VCEFKGLPAGPYAATAFHDENGNGQLDRRFGYPLELPQMCSSSPAKPKTFSNVTLEAMASGLAVIAYDYAAAKMHIRHGETGVLVPYGDSTAFVESAARLVRNPSSLGWIRKRAREYIASLKWRSVVERFEMLLTSAPALQVDSPRLFDNIDNRPRFGGEISAGGRICQSKASISGQGLP
jgi:hypothetical protein